MLNEKSKELILKAGFENSYTNPQDGFEIVFVGEEETTRNLEELIKLVVTKCAVIATREASRGGEHAGAEMLELFGIE